MYTAGTQDALCLNPDFLMCGLLLATVRGGVVKLNRWGKPVALTTEPQGGTKNEL